MKNFSQGSRSSSRDLNVGPPEYDAGVLAVRPRRSVTAVFFCLCDWSGLLRRVPSLILHCAFVLSTVTNVTSFQ
jgi:hypothetical protein